MQCFIHVSKNRGFLVPFLHHHHHPVQTDLDYVNPHPHHHRMLKVVVMFALRRSRPTHHTDRWHRLQRQYRTNKVCATPQRNQVLQGVEIPVGWLSLTFEKKKLSLDSVCTALFNQVEVSQRSRLQIFKHKSDEIFGPRKEQRTSFL